MLINRDLDYFKNISINYIKNFTDKNVYSKIKKYVWLGYTDQALLQCEKKTEIKKTTEDILSDKKNCVPVQKRGQLRI